MPVMLKRWNDDKMDALDAKVDGLGAQLREQRQETSARLDGLDGRLDAMQRTMIYLAVTISGSVVVGFAAVIGVLAAKL